MALYIVCPTCLSVCFGSVWLRLWCTEPTPHSRPYVISYQNTQLNMKYTLYRAPFDMIPIYHLYAVSA